MAKRTQVSTHPWKPHGHDHLAAGEVSTRAASPVGDWAWRTLSLPHAVMVISKPVLAWYEFPPAVGASARTGTKITP